MKKTLVLLLVALVLAVGCITQEKEVQTEYVCPDGHTVGNPASCIQEPEAVYEYVCTDGRTVDDAKECETTESTSTTVATTSTTLKTVTTTLEPATTTLAQVTTTLDSDTGVVITPVTTTEPTTTQPTTTSTVKTTTSTTTTTTPESDSDQDCINLGCSAGTRYVGSVNSDKYHVCTCTYAKRIKTENLVCFQSKDEAEAAGYIPCGVCKPAG